MDLLGRGTVFYVMAMFKLSKLQQLGVTLPEFFLTILFSMKCTESEEEEPIKGKESQLQLSCFINQEVKYLATGLRLVCIRKKKHVNCE